MNGDYLNIEQIAGQYVDMLNIKYINMTKEKRLKNLSSIAKRIAEYRYDGEHEEIMEVVGSAAREYGCSPGEVRLRGIEIRRILFGEWVPLYVSIRWHFMG